MVKDASQSGSAISQFIGGLQKRFLQLGQWLASFGLFRQASAYVQEGFQNIRELNASFVELSRISNDSSAALQQFREQSFNIAHDLGSTATTVLNAATTWEHLGYSIKDAAELAKSSATYVNIADGMSSDAEATEDLVSILKAYKKEASDSMDVVDALIATSNNYAVSAADIGSALKRSAASMAVANNSFEQNVALATAMTEVTQNAEKSGSALNILALRIRGAKAELEDMGEDTDGMAESSSKLRKQIKALTGGFDIMADSKNFKSTYDIIKGIAEVWDQMSDVSQSALLETLAGKNRANQVAALISNFSQAEKVMKTIAEDEGVAEANNAAKLDSINGRLNQLKNQGLELSQAAFNETAIKSTVSVLTDLLDVITEIVKVVGPFGLGSLIIGGAQGAHGGGISKAAPAMFSRIFKRKGSGFSEEDIAEAFSGLSKDVKDSFVKRGTMSIEEFLK